MSVPEACVSPMPGAPLSEAELGVGRRHTCTLLKTQQCPWLVLGHSSRRIMC